MSPSESRGLAGLLQNRAYRSIWQVGLFTNGAVWLEMLVAGVYAFDATHSPLLVALLIILRLVPLAVFGSAMGTLADRMSPRLLLGLTLTTTAAVSASVVILFSAGYASYWVIAAASFASGLVWTADMPLRRRILGDIVGKERLAPAMSLDNATNNATRIIGPFLGGFIYQELDTSGAFGLSACLYAASALLLLRVPSHASWRTADQRGKEIMKDFREAFTFARENNDLLRILLLTMVFNIWGFPFISMIPVIGREELMLSASWIGILAALEGVGASTGALLIAVKARAASFRKIYFFSILSYLLFAFAASLLIKPLPMALILLGVGFAGAGFSTMQSTLIYYIAPPHMRSRLFGLMVTSIGTGILGALNMGLMGELFSGSVAVGIVAAEGLIPLLIIGAGWRQLRDRMAAFSEQRGDA